VWTAAEIKRYLKECYSIIAARTECFWNGDFLDDKANTCNITAEWERDLHPGDVLGVFNFTGAFEEEMMPGGPALGPCNHTAAHETEDLAFIGKAVYDLPTDLIRIERATWDNRRIDPLYSSELEPLDAQYHTRKGNPQGYVMDKDGLRVLRKVPIPTAETTATTNNFKIEYIRKGSAVSADGDTFELPDRYTKYLRHYACWRCLEREGPGQDLQLGAFWKNLYESGVARMIRRKQLFNQRRNVVMGGSSERLSRPPLARMPFSYGRVVR